MSIEVGVIDFVFDVFDIVLDAVDEVHLQFDFLDNNGDLSEVRRYQETTVYDAVL